MINQTNSPFRQLKTLSFIMSLLTNSTRRLTSAQPKYGR